MEITIDEAIEIIRKHLVKRDSVEVIDLHKAERLGIEALKQIKDMRDFKYWGRPIKLPGETGEQLL